MMMSKKIAAKLLQDIGESTSIESKKLKTIDPVSQLSLLALADAIKMAIAALRGPQLDPETGLVRCGCGAKAKMFDWQPENRGEVILYQAGCSEDCPAVTDWEKDPKVAEAVWNKMMGYKEADQCSAE